MAYIVLAHGPKEFTFNSLSGTEGNGFVTNTLALHSRAPSHFVPGSL